jgi:hypothetical protein
LGLGPLCNALDGGRNGGLLAVHPFWRGINRRQIEQSVTCRVMTPVYLLRRSLQSWLGLAAACAVDHGSQTAGHLLTFGSTLPCHTPSKTSQFGMRRLPLEASWPPLSPLVQSMSRPRTCQITANPSHPPSTQARPRLLRQPLHSLSPKLKSLSPSNRSLTGSSWRLQPNRQRRRDEKT